MIVKKTKKYVIEKDDGLIDDCKYMLYFEYGWEWDGYHSVPCRTIKEAMEFAKDAVYEGERAEELAKTDFIKWMNDFHSDDFDKMNEADREVYLKQIRKLIKKCTEVVNKGVK